MEACCNFQENPKLRRYYKLPINNPDSRVVEVEFLTEDDFKNADNRPKITQFRQRNTTPNFVVDGIRNRIRLSLFMRLILVIGTSITILICLLIFGKFKT